MKKILIITVIMAVLLTGCGNLWESIYTLQNHKAVPPDMTTAEPTTAEPTTTEQTSSQNENKLQNATYEDESGKYDAISDGEKLVAVLSFEEIEKIGDKTPNGKFILFKIAIKNLSKDAIAVDSSQLAFIDSTGNVYRSDTVAGLTLSLDQNDISTFSLMDKINPNMTSIKYAVFDLPKDLTTGQMWVSDILGNFN